MAAVAATFDAGEIAVEVEERRAGNMSRTIRALAGLDVGEIVTAIDDDKRGIV
jgi:hypothetical protein